jgi:UDP-N-acetylenolpyruvoylglucosamine reductase
VTHDGATAQDVYELTRQMAAAVKEKFGLVLVREVRLLGRFDHADGLNENGYW